ncbi:hypothetical protein PHISP_00679 [Aspergillus sp. HF37]|nr:hypothetical protein PHISP_00679 [Aspergillus sp. HF37]
MGKLSREGIIFLVILGCVIVVLMGYAIHYTLTGGFYREEDHRDMPDEQRNYMKQLRHQNRQWLASESARGKPPHYGV